MPKTLETSFWFAFFIFMALNETSNDALMAVLWLIYLPFFHTKLKKIKLVLKSGKFIKISTGTHGLTQNSETMPVPARVKSDGYP